jgi:GT2 family glycosyltransferase
MPAHPAPRVRVVVLNYDGGDMTLRCLDSLRLVDYPQDRLEVVLVDNASIDGIADRVRDEYPWVTLVESFHNRGFSGGCNLGIGNPSDGAYDYVALLNNDALAAPGWLRPLVDALDADGGVGAASSKMLFAERAWGVRLDMAPTYESRTNPFYKGLGLTGVKVDGVDRFDDVGFDEGFWGLLKGPVGGTDLAWSKARGEVRIGERHVLEPPRTMSLRVNAPTARRVRLSTTVETLDIDLTTEPTWYTLALPDEPFDIVNNAGSCLFQNGYAGDRGFLERDDGQFDEADEVFAWCGGAVLLRASYLADVGLFDERFFLYYEDTDLSWRGRLKGWRYVYTPDSVVRHEHAATSGAGSSFFRFYVDRNRLLTLAKNAPLPMLLHAVRTEVLPMTRALVREVGRGVKHGRPPRWGRGKQQLDSMRSAAALLGAIRHERAGQRAAAVIDDADVMGWAVTK